METQFCKQVLNEKQQPQKKWREKKDFVGCYLLPVVFCFCFFFQFCDVAKVMTVLQEF